MSSKIVALLSDFGLADHYVGVMKAEILRRAPSARLIDLTHGIAPQGVRQGSFYLEQSLQSFPRETIFLCVVDPGVGSARRAVAVRAGEFYFVAPDNGLIATAVEGLGGASEMVELSLPQDSSSTFHGRDVFAPAAGLLAGGKKFTALGEPCENLTQLSSLPTIKTESSLEVAVLFADHFGNLCLNLRRSEGWPPLIAGAELEVEGEKIPFGRTFSDVDPGKSLLLWNSSNYLELAVRDGNARKEWGFGDGEFVVIGG